MSDGPRPRPRPRPRPTGLLLVVVGAAYALLLANTTPFTTDADVLTAVPIAALAVVLVVRWPLRTRAVRFPDTDPTGHPFRPWLVWFVAETAWEVYTYAARGPRADHPTISSMTDAVDRTYVLKVLVILAWLALGALILRRGRGRRQRSRTAP